MRHPRTLAALALSLATLAGAGCVNALDVAEVGDSAPVFVAQGDNLLDNFDEREAGFHETHVIAAHGPFSRIGLRFDAVGVVVVEARVSSDGGATFGDWTPSNVVFDEAEAHNAFVDVATGRDGAGATHLQLRFAAPVESQLTFLAVDAFDKDAEAAGDVVGSDVEAEQPLSGTLVNSRSAWGARARSCSDPHTPVKVSIHHTETPNQDSLSVEARLRQIQSYHIDVRGWCDIGYHFLISPDGRIWQGRPETNVAAHVSGANTGNVGISFIGDYQTTAPSAAMQSSASRLLTALHDAYGIALDRSHVKTHREQGETSCPGDALQARVNDIVNNATVTTPPPPPPPAPEGNGSTCTQVTVVGADTLNVRPSASTSQSPRGTVSAGDVLDVTSVVSGQTVSGTSTWYGIRRGSLSGFISGAYAACTQTSDDGGVDGEGEEEPGDEPGDVSADVYDGLDRGTASIPRAGLANDTLRNALGVSTEPYGSLFQYEGHDYVRGRVSSFGGPNDTGVSSTETGSVTGERLRSLNSPLNASAATIASRPDDFYFIAMRWDYTPHGVGFWRTARILVVNPQNGKKVVLRPVDWGPNTSTRRILDISPQALKDLGADTDANLLVAFAAVGAAVGVVP